MLLFGNNYKSMLVQSYLCEHYRHSPNDDFHVYVSRWSMQFRMQRDQQARMGQCKHMLLFGNDFKILFQGYLCFVSITDIPPMTMLIFKVANGVCNFGCRVTSKHVWEMQAHAIIW